ncbi:hypothetical protein F0562_033606 [Nyssa sinensis]|uniref:DYW domain-containing protein n=1 Tax=Nyssa sinensis TaxID=561372 RepID=A0A5J5AGN5_9ASTE|nr:hypothetical protein F0562_033606 [Nyssa sinensis]
MRELKQIPAQIIKEDNFSPHQIPVELSKLLSFCAVSPHGSLAYAKTIFSQEPNPSVSLCNSLIRGLSSSQQPLEALSLYQKILRSGLQPNNLTFPFVIKACTKSSVTQYGILIHTHVIKCGFEYDSYIQCSLIHLYANGKNLPAAKQLFDMCSERDVVSWNSMIDGYAKSGDMESARTVFDRMVIRDEISWNTMINGYGILGRIDEAKSLFDEMPERNVISWNSMLAALDLFDEMQATGIKPTEATVVSLLSACAHLGALDQGLCLHSYISDHKIEINHIFGTALVDMYAKWSSMTRASEVFYSMESKDVLAWNTIIIGMAMHGRAKDAQQLFKEMQENGVTPDDITFVAMLGSYRHGGMIEECWRLLACMSSTYRIDPKIEHYGCAIDLLSRAGQLEEAMDLIGTMRGETPYQSSTTTSWPSLIQRPPLRFLEIFSDHELPSAMSFSQTYMLLQNNGMMQERLKTTIGYSPDKEQVLLDIEEEEKEHALSVHSEKLAIAYGLLHLGPGEAVRIVKNLRVCRDCHYVTKLISRTYGREIIVRDRNRFHHFKDGGCSCLDFW